jgi:hypothetical protein
MLLPPDAVQVQQMQFRFLARAISIYFGYVGRELQTETGVLIMRIVSSVLSCLSFLVLVNSMTDSDCQKSNNDRHCAVSVSPKSLSEMSAVQNMGYIAYRRIEAE